MKKYLFVTFIIFTINSFSQKKDTINLGVNHYTFGVLKDSLKHGVWVTYLDEKRERVEQYNKGQVTGDWFDFYPNGEIAIKAVFDESNLIYFEFNVFNNLTKEYVKERSIKIDSGFSQTQFWQLIRTENNNGNAKAYLSTSERKQEESVMIGKRINSQISETEFADYINNKSLSSILRRLDSLNIEKFYRFCLNSGNKCEYIIYDGFGKVKKTFYFDNNHEIKVALRSRTRNIPYEKIFINRKLKEEGRISNGEKVGWWTVYDESEKYLKEVYYKKGVIQRTK